MREFADLTTSMSELTGIDPEISGGGSTGNATGLRARVGLLGLRRRRRA